MYSISFAEVKQYLESLPSDDSVTGEVCNTQKCLIAKAVLAKYPTPVAVWVEPADWVPDWIRVYFIDDHGEPHWVKVETGEDDAKLRELAKGFDRFDIQGKYQPTKAEVLEELF